MMYKFANKVALVTGAGSGSGRAAALGFAQSGAAVIVSDVNLQGGEATVAMVEANGGKATFVKCDVAKAGEVDALLERCVTEYGRLVD